MYIRADVAGAFGELGKPIVSFRKKVRTSVAEHGVSRLASAEAKRLMNEVFDGLSQANVSRLDGTGVRLHLIPHDKQLTDLGEFKGLKGKPTPDGKVYDSVRATGGVRSGGRIEYAVAEETIVSIPGKLQRYHLGYFVSHESGRVVFRFALTSDQKNRLNETFRDRGKASGTWVGDYAGVSPEAYFAASTAAFFGHPQRDMVPYLSRFTRTWLAENDPPMHALLSEIYQHAA